MGKSIFVDLTRCHGCRGCQVACKQWKNTPGEKTVNWGSHQNPADLTYQTIRLVRFSEAKVLSRIGDEEPRLEWLFFPEQCRHCYTAPCKTKADEYDKKAIFHDPETGAVVFTERMRHLKGDAIREACPYDIPRTGPKGKDSSKCDFCFDRISNGLIPSCVLACPTGCMNYGEDYEMIALAKQRLEEVRKEFPKAYLGDVKNTRVIFLYQTDHRLYYQDPIDG